MSLGWLSIGATKDITLTGLNVDGGTLFVDKVNNRVGVGINTQVGLGSTSLSNVLQVGETSVGISTYNPLSSSGIAMFSNKYTSPDITGDSNFGATLWINSTNGYLQNAGASIGLGAINSSSLDGRHTTYARISGVQAKSTDDRKGDFVIETTNTDKMYERVRVTSDGKIGIGTDTPSSKLHVSGNILSETGITNNGYRREEPANFGFANSSTQKVPNDKTLSMLTPAGTGRGWLARIDDGSELDPQSEYINGVISSATDRVVFAVGTFTGTVNLYQEGGLNVENTFQTDQRAFPQAQSGFVARYTDEGSIERFAVVEYPSAVVLTAVTLLGISEADVLVTGYLTKTSSANLRIYNSGSPVSGEGSQQPVPGISDGGKVGFVILYDHDLTFKRLVYINTTEGLGGEVMPTNCVAYYNNSPGEKILYVSGQFKATASNFTTSATSGTGTVATITTTLSHGFVAGDKVLVYGVTPTAYNGLQTVLSTPTTTSFTFSSSATGSQTVAGSATRVFISVENTNYPGPSDQGAITAAPVRTTSYDVFLCRYDITTVGSDNYLAPVWMNTVQNSTGTTDDIIEHPSRALAVDESIVGTAGGDVYMCGYSRSSTLRIYGSNWVQVGSSFTLQSCDQMGFLAGFTKAGVLKWRTRVAPVIATPSSSTDYATVRSITFHSDSKRLIATGSFKSTNVSFFNPSSILDANSVGSQTGIEDKYSAFVVSYDCSSASSANVVWSTKIQPQQQNVYGMLIDNDVNGNIYTSFHLISTSTTYDNVKTNVFTAQGPDDTNLTNHSVTGVADYIGIVCYNPNGKVLFTSKIDGSGTENIRAMDVYGPDADDPSRLIIGMVSGGFSFNCFDMTGISFKFATNLYNTPASGTTSAFVIQFPSFTFYLMDTPPEDEEGGVIIGTVKKFINTTKNRAYVIPYYDPDDSVTTAYTKNIFAVPGSSSIELTHGGPETWYVAKDSDSSSVYVDKINGGVGIGTTEPQRLLHVDGDALVRGNMFIDGLIINPYITFGLSGAIGIGTTNPLAFLHIYKPNPRIILQNSVTGNNQETSGTLDFFEKNSTGARLTYDGRSGVDSFLVSMVNAPGVATPAIAVSNKTNTLGYVGIGTTNPVKRLHVKDSFRIEAQSRRDSSFKEQQVNNWYPPELDYGNFTMSSCAYAPNIGVNGIGRWVVAGYANDSDLRGYIAYSDDGGSSWEVGTKTTGDDVPAIISLDKLKSVNPGVDPDLNNFNGTLDYSNYTWVNVKWIEAAPVAPPESELATLTESTVLSSNYSGIVKVNGKYSPAETVITLPNLTSDDVGRTITIMKMDINEDTIVRVTTNGTNISASASVWLGRNTNSDVNRGCVGASGQSSRNNLRVVWTTGGYWNVDGPNDHPDFPDGVFIALNNDGSGSNITIPNPVPSVYEPNNANLAYSFKHERQNWVSTLSYGTAPDYFENTIVYKYAGNTGTRTAFTAGLSLGANGALVLGPNGGTRTSQFMTPRDMVAKGTNPNAKFYVCGWYSSDSIVTLDVGKTLPLTGSVNRAFIIKFSQTGAIDWAKSIVSTGASIAYGVAVDSADNVYITGQYNSTTTIPLDTGVTLPSTSGNNRLFIVKLNSSGLFTAQYGHPTANGSYGGKIVTRSNTDVFYSGIRNSSTILLGRIDPSLSSATVIEQTITSPTLSGISSPPSLAMNTSGTRVYLVGRYKSDTSISVGSAYTLPARTGSGPCQGFLISFQIASPFTGFTSVWGTAIICPSVDYSDIISVTTDQSGNVFVTGSYESSVPVELTTGGAVLPVTYKYGVAIPEPQHSFVASYNSQGESRWAKTIPNTQGGYGNSIIRDSSNNIYVAGVFNSDPGKKLFIGTDQNGENKYLYPNSAEIVNTESAFLIKYSGDNGSVEWARNHGMDPGNAIDRPLIAIDGSNYVYWGMDFKGRSRSYQSTIDQCEAGERWFVTNTGYGYEYSTSVYDSLANRLMLFSNASADPGPGDSRIVYTEDIGRDYSIAGNFWAKGTGYWNTQTVVGDDMLGAYYKQGSRSGTGYGVAGGNCNSYTMTARDAEGSDTNNIGIQYFIRSDEHLAQSLTARSFGGNNTIQEINLRDIAYSPQLNRFVCCGVDGWTVSTTTNEILVIDPDNEEDISSAGTDFALQGFSIGSRDWFGITWSADLGYFVAVSYDNQVGSIAYSSDGSSWTYSSNPATTNSGTEVVLLKRIGWGSQTGFLAVGKNSSNGRVLLRSRVFPDPGNTLVDTQTEITSDGKLLSNLVFGKAPFYTPNGSAPLFMVRAWASFNGRSTDGLYNYGNIKSITRKATGVYEFLFTTPMPTDTYAIVLSGGSHADIRDPGTYTPGSSGGLKPSTTKFRVSTRTTGDNAADYEYVCVMVIC